MDKLLQEIRDELADHWVDEGWGLGKSIDEQHCLDSFIGGWDAAVKHLAERASEGFDEYSATEASDDYWNGCEDSALAIEKSFEAGARWQFIRLSAERAFYENQHAKSAAKIEALEAEVKRYREALLKCRDDYVLSDTEDEFGTVNGPMIAMIDDVLNNTKENNDEKKHP